MPPTAFSFAGSGASRSLIVTPAPNQSGTATIRVTVSDGILSATDAFVLTVRPLTVNQPPVADASASPLQVISRNNVNAAVTLDGSRSTDPNGDQLSYTWFADGNLTTPIGAGVTETVTFRVGVHEVVLVVNDGQASDSDTIVVEVIGLAGAIGPITDRIKGLDLPSGYKKELIHKLEVAANAIEVGDFTRALQQLRVVHNKITAQTGHKFDPDIAEELLSKLQQIVRLIEGG